MNREETLALYEQGVDAWNKWANEMLVERKRLEEAGMWIGGDNQLSLYKPKSEATITWLKNAEANFSSIENPHIFEKNIEFSSFIFPGNTLFQHATFSSETSFYSCQFKGDTDFVGTTFERYTLFEHVTFNGIASFSNVKFNDETAIINSSFEGLTWFNYSTFEDYVTFQNTDFKKTTEFEKIKFLDNANFKNTSFSKQIDFHEIIFTGKVWFDSIQCYEEITFKDSKFEETSFFTSTTFKGYTSFHNVNFEKEANFNAISSANAFTLENAFFKNKLPNFIQANFKEAPRLDNIKIGDNVPPGSFKNSITTYIHSDIKASYQALKRLAVQAHDHENEQRFWAGELRSDRSLRTEDGGWNLRPLFSAFWWGNIAYGFFSDYGRSIVRPLGTLLVLVILMTGLHLSISKEPLSYENAFSAGYISASKSIFNLGADPTKRSILKEKYSALYGVTENQTPNIPKSILIAEMGQTLLSAIFIFLTLLGVRNNFKMK